MPAPVYVESNVPEGNRVVPESDWKRVDAELFGFTSAAVNVYFAVYPFLRNINYFCYSINVAQD